MPSINDRIGSQNVIRVLSNASAPPSNLLNLNDVESTLKTRDGMILVWDLTTEKFYMTDTIDSSSLNITGIVTFSNTTDSTAPTNGALVIDGGIGIGKAVNIGGDISVAGLSTFTSNVDINAAVDILNGLTVNSTFKSVGITTLASAGDITTTGGNLNVGGNISVTGTATFGTGTVTIDGDNDNIVVGNGITISSEGGITTPSINIGGSIQANSLSISGASTLASAGGITTTGGELYVGTNLEVAGTSNFIGNATFRGGTIGIGDSTSDDIDVGGEFVSNLVPNTDNTYDIGITTQRWRDGKFSGLVTTTNLFVSGISTFLGDKHVTGNVRITGFASVTEGLYYDANDYDGPNGIAYFDDTGKLIGAASTENALTESYFVLTTNNVGIPTWTSVIDGGVY